MSVLTALQLDGGARSSVQIVSVWVSLNQVVQFWGSEVENWSVTFVEKSVNFDGGEVFLCVSTANFGQDVCVGGGGLSSWVWHLGGQSDAKPT